MNVGGAEGVAVHGLEELASSACEVVKKSSYKRYRDDAPSVGREYAVGL